MALKFGRREAVCVTHEDLISSRFPKITAGVDLALEALGLVAGSQCAPTRVVADEVAPAPALEGIIQGEGVATVAADLEPEADQVRRILRGCFGCTALPSAAWPPRRVITLPLASRITSKLNVELNLS